MLKDLRMCFVGDSFVNGTGDESKLGWTGRVCAALEGDYSGVEITHYNLGIRRNTTEDILGRWQSECAQRLAGNFDKWVVFSFGVNDTVIENGSVRVDCARSVDHARAILTQASSEYRVLLVGPPPIADDEQNIRIRAFDRAMADLCGDIEVPYLSVIDTLVSDEVWMREVASNDGAHPKASGYARLASIVLAWAEWHRVMC